MRKYPLPEGEGACLQLDASLGLALSCLDPPPSRRVELCGSGAPSGMTAQPQLVQGCTICGVPSDPESEMREPAAGGRLGGGGLSFGDFSLATQRKVTRPRQKGGRNPVEGEALASCAVKPRHHIQSANVRIRCAIRTYDSITPGDYGFPHPDSLPRGEGTKTLGAATSRK